MVAQLYDEIAIGYRNYRRPDPCLGTAIHRALGNAQIVVNVGAGTGSYEPTDRAVVAVEPSRAMINQRQPGRASVVQASATDLPFRDAAFSAALAILTMHHWEDQERGLAELARVAQDRIVIVTHSWEVAPEGFWLVDDYFPEIVEIDRSVMPMPSLAKLRRLLGRVEVIPLPIPHDCVDGFLGAYWRRPHAYLETGVRSAISAFSRLHDVDAGLARLRSDLASGTWKHRYGHLLHRLSCDLGYRLVIAKCTDSR